MTCTMTMLENELGFSRIRHADAPHVVASLRTQVDIGSWQMEYEDALMGIFVTSKSGIEVGRLPSDRNQFLEDVTKAKREVLLKL